MTARVVLSCDGKEGIFACRQAIPVGAVKTGVDARRIAKAEGWSSYTAAFQPSWQYEIVDLCPACTRKGQR